MLWSASPLRWRWPATSGFKGFFCGTPPSSSRHEPGCRISRRRLTGNSGTVCLSPAVQRLQLAMRLGVTGGSQSPQPTVWIVSGRRRDVSGVASSVDQLPTWPGGNHARAAQDISSQFGPLAPGPQYQYTSTFSTALGNTETPDGCQGRWIRHRQHYRSAPASPRAGHRPSGVRHFGFGSMISARPSTPFGQRQVGEYRPVATGTGGPRGTRQRGRARRSLDWFCAAERQDDPTVGHRARPLQINQQCSRRSLVLR